MKERSYFWPLVLIAIGVLWLLSNMGLMPANHLWALVHMLPYVLIALGFGLILRAFWRPAGMLVSLLVVTGAVLGVIYAPQFGWDEYPSWSVWRIDSPDFGGHVAGSGIITTETRTLPDFNAVSIEVPADVTILQGESASLRLTGDDNLLPQIRSEVKGGVLVIENEVREWNQRVRPTKPIQIELTVSDLSEVDFPTAGRLLVEEFTGKTLQISVSGAGDVALNKVALEELSLRLSGAGDVSADGNAGQLTLSISGLGSFKGAELRTQSAGVSISGAGDAIVWAEQSLDVRISGAGSVRYYGQPENFSEQISGAGNVRDLGEK
jgi:hypothetical protein